MARRPPGLTVEGPVAKLDLSARLYPASIVSAALRTLAGRASVERVEGSGRVRLEVKSLRGSPARSLAGELLNELLARQARADALRAGRSRARAVVSRALRSATPTPAQSRRAALAAEVLEAEARRLMRECARTPEPRPS